MQIHFFAVQVNEQMNTVTFENISVNLLILNIMESGNADKFYLTGKNVTYSLHHAKQTTQQSST